MFNLHFDNDLVLFKKTIFSYMYMYIMIYFYYFLRFILVYKTIKSKLFKIWNLWIQSVILICFLKLFVLSFCLNCWHLADGLDKIRRVYRLAYNMQYFKFFDCKVRFVLHIIMFNLTNWKNALCTNIKFRVLSLHKNIYEN